MVFVVEKVFNKKKELETFSNDQIKKCLEVGKFYIIHDGSQNGHPGYIIWKNDSRNLYLSIKFGTSKNENNKEFPHSLSNEGKNTYVYKRTFLGKRKDYGKTEFDKLLLGVNDFELLKQIVNFDSPIHSKNISRKDIKFFNWIKKVPFIRGNCPAQRAPYDSTTIQNKKDDVNN